MAPLNSDQFAGGASNNTISDKFYRLNNTPRRHVAVKRVRNLFVVAKHDFPEKFAEGMAWYGEVHDIARQTPHGLDKAAGMIAALSPNADFENSNIPALHDIASLTSEHWDAIHANVAAGGKRNADVKALLRESAPSLSRTSNANIVKAGRILNGENWRDVLDEQTAPKTHAFASNIYDPSAFGRTTMDGRQADIVSDVMRPWKQSRGGLQNKALKRGGTTQYQQKEHIHNEVAEIMGVRPHEVQAVSWVMGQHVERQFDPSRAKGDTRVGQSYQGRVSPFLEGVNHGRLIVPN